MNNLRTKSLHAVSWSFLNVIGTKLISFLVLIYLARILAPADFGLIGMIMIFMDMSRILIEGGLLGSLIRTPNPDELDFSSVFIINLLVSIFVYICCYMLAPYISIFYEQPVLTEIIRIYCIGFIIFAISGIQRTRFLKELDFKTQLKINLPTTLISGMVGIISANLGYGVWSLVYMYLVKEAMNTSLYWYWSKWYPKIAFDLKKYKYHFYYGSKLMLSQIIEKLNGNLYYVIIGKFFSPAFLGFYTTADKASQFPKHIFLDAVSRVTFPLFAKISDQPEKLKATFKKTNQLFFFFYAPVIMILIALAEPVILFLFSAKWLPVVPFFQLFCVIGLYHPIHYFNLNLLKVYNRTDLVLKLESLNIFLVLTNIFLVIQNGYGVYGLLLGQILIANISLIINIYISGRYINYRSIEQIKDIVPAIVLSLFTMIVVYWADTTLFTSFLSITRIVVGSLLGGAVFLLLSTIIQLASLAELRVLLLQLKNDVKGYTLAASKK